MQELIKNIRKFKGLSQQEFSEKLGVTFATINRWENGKTPPISLLKQNYMIFVKRTIFLYTI